MKKLGKTLIVIGLLSLILDYGWSCIWNLTYEPAGNAVQEFFLAFPHQFNRVFHFLAHSLTETRIELFWLGVALWFVGRKESE